MNLGFFRFIEKNTPFFKWVHKSKQLIIPGFGRVPVYYIIRFFIEGLKEGYITSRAASIAFNFFIALFPGVIFLFSLIAFLPISGLQEGLLMEIERLMPAGSFTYVEGTLTDLINHKRTSLLSFGIIATLYFTTNGVNSIISAFNLSYHSNWVGERGWINQQLTATWLTLVLLVSLLIGVGFLLFGQNIIDLLVENAEAFSGFQVIMLQLLRYTVTLSFIYFAVSFLFYVAPKNRSHWVFFSPGSTIATLFIIGFSALFAAYVSSFDSYNKLYGSIGTLMMIMLWIYFNCIVLLIGYELNASIKGARAKYAPHTLRK